MDISNEVKTQVITQEIVTYENTRYLLSIRHRVNKKIGSTPEQLKVLEDEMVKIEMALDELKAIQKELSQTRILTPAASNNGK